jgi:hypothetical protein
MNQHLNIISLDVSAFVAKASVVVGQFRTAVVNLERSIVTKLEEANHLANLMDTIGMRACENSDGKGRVSVGGGGRPPHSLPVNVTVR